MGYSSNTEEFAREYYEECGTSIGLSYGVYYLPLQAALPITLSKYPYESIPKLYAPMGTEAVEETGAIRLQNIFDLSLRGQGVLIGIIDDGIDARHKAFRYSDKSSRIYRVWDQTNQTGIPPETQRYGSEYTQDEINEELRREEMMNTMESSILNSLGKDSEHGTFIAGVAGGSEDIRQEFTSPAPSCEFVIVKLKPAKRYLREYYQIANEAKAFQENDVLQALIYMRQIAATSKRPIVICFSIGSSQGPHSGQSLFAELLDNSASKNQITVVTPAGNEGNKSHHYLGTLFGNGGAGDNRNRAEETVELRVGPGVKGFTMELWGKSPDLYSIGITSPRGERIGRVPAKLGANFFYQFVLGTSSVYIDYVLVDRFSGDELVFMRFERPDEGIWQFHVSGENIILGNYHMWLPVDSFLSGEVFFLRANPDFTITSPGDAITPITIGGYDGITGGIDPESGRGYTTNMFIKPDLCAPSVNVMGPAGNDRYQYMTGTSVAAALASGVTAQLIEWQEGRGNQNTSEIKNYLIRGATRDANLRYPNRQWGYGKIDGYETLRILAVSG